MQIRGNGGKIFDYILKIIAALSVAVCSSMFVYVIKIENKISEYDSYIKYQESIILEQKGIHVNLNSEIRELSKTLALLITDVRIIQGNYFTSRDGTTFLAEITKLADTVGQLRNELNDINRILRKS